MRFHSFFNHQNVYWGKVIGGAFGYLMGGPAGALFGILVGNFFDKGLTQHLNQPYFDLYTQRQEAIYPLFMNTTFIIMGYIAKADGRVSEASIHFAKNTMKSFRLTKKQTEVAKANFNLGKTQNVDITKTLMAFKQGINVHQSLMMTFLSIQYQAALHAGLSHAKLQALNFVFQTLGYAPIQKQYQYDEDDPFSSYSYSSADPPPRTHHQQPFTLAEAYAALNVDTLASKATVKQAYRRLMSQHHPDKLMAQGKSEQEIKLANDKTQKIRKAYETICTAKGW